jgi:hypothetical protein
MQVGGKAFARQKTRNDQPPGNAAALIASHLQTGLLRGEPQIHEAVGGQQLAKGLLQDAQQLRPRRVAREQVDVVLWRRGRRSGSRSVWEPTSQGRSNHSFAPAGLRLPLSSLDHH